jgi:hypothetical protein
VAQGAMKMMPMIMEKYRIGGMLRRSMLIAAAVAVLTGCAGSSAVEVKGTDYTAHSVRVLAIAPPNINDSSELGDAVGVELAKHGYTVVDTMAILAKYDLPPKNALDPREMEALKKEGIDAVVSVSSVGSVMGGPGMRHANAKVISTSTSRQIGEIDWNNSWGGMPGSLADYMMRKGVAGAAREIADALAKLLGLSG